MSLTGRHEKERNNKIKTPHYTTKMNVYSSPHFTHLVAAPTLKPQEMQLPKE